MNQKWDKGDNLMSNFYLSVVIYLLTQRNTTIKLILIIYS